MRWCIEMEAMYRLPGLPDPKTLLTPPWTGWYDSLEKRWIVESDTKPKDSLVYGIKWKELDAD